MQSLENKKELQCFLGMINHLRKFVPDLSENTENLRKFLQKDTGGIGILLHMIVAL